MKTDFFIVQEISSNFLYNKNSNIDPKREVHIYANEFPQKTPNPSGSKKGIPFNRKNDPDQKGT